MQIEGVDFPRPLLNALRDEELVVFAGAGVSMGEPANLPSFKGLTKKIAQGIGDAPKRGETDDQFLGRLSKNRGTKVHERTERELSRDAPKPTDLHRDLLRLFPKAESTRIVTTNFDLLFEDAAMSINLKPEVFRAPALPLGNDFNGIVHVHGAVSHFSGMVLTDADFGRAYLTEGWARRFLLDLFRSFAVLFVGYSHSDTIMNYLARALPTDGGKHRFALTDDAEGGQWQLLGVEPIKYPRVSGDKHEALYEGVGGLAKYATRGILDWKREITEISNKSPSLNEEETGLIEEALTDVTKTRFFTDAAASPEWINWLDERKYLDSLFSVGDMNELNDRDRLLARWLASKFAREHANEIFLLVGRHGMRLHPVFWDRLSGVIGQDKEPPLATEVLSRWVSLLIAAAPAHSGEDISFRMGALGESCIKAGLTDSLIEVFNALAASRLAIEKNFPSSLSGEDTDGAHPPVRVELRTTGELNELQELWEEELKPNLAGVAETLLVRVVERLGERHRALRAWQAATRDLDLESFSRSAIEPHEQNIYLKPIAVLIDAGRDCLEWLASYRREAAARWCEQLIVSEAPLLRRLAAHTLFVRVDLTPNEKINWLLSHADLHDKPLHYELFRGVKQIYSDADPKRRNAIIEAVRAFRWPREEDEDKEEWSAHYHFRWFHWLHSADPNCALAQKALDEVLKRYPDFKPEKHPDLRSWIEPTLGPSSPWTVEELLARPAKEWVDELLSFRQKDFRGPDRHGLVCAVEDAANQRFEWGVALADELAGREAWDSDLWANLMRAWGNKLTEDRHRKVLGLLGKSQELYQERAHEIAYMLDALVRDGNVPYAHELLQEANKIALTLWDRLDRAESSDLGTDYPNTAINHPGGKLADFWLNSLSIWRKRQDPKPNALTGDYLEALSRIVQDGSLAGRRGRSILARNLSFLLAVDEEWTKENLLPLFKAHENKNDYQAVWDGFRYARISPPVAELMKDACLDAVSKIESHFSDAHRRRESFINLYVIIMAYFVDDPLETWIPKFFDNAGEDDWRQFASALGIRHLKGLSEEKQREWWERWLKRYWENRLEGVPRQLPPGEIGKMLDWLAYLKGDLFPEAVKLAVRVPQELLERPSSRIIYRIKEDKLWQRWPESVAKLLLHLGGAESPYRWYGGKELIDELLTTDIPNPLKKKLEELSVELGL